MRNLRKVVYVIYLAIISMILVGCGSIPDSAIIDLENQMNQRVNENGALLDKLCNAGLISTSENEQIHKSMTDSAATVIKSLNSNESSVDSTSVNLLLDSVVDWSCVPNCATTNPNEDDSDFDSKYISNYFASAINAGGVGGMFLNMSFKGIKVNKAGNLIRPITLITEENAATLTERLNYPIYIMKSDVSLDNVVALLDTYANGVDGVTNDFYSKAAMYFEPMKSEDGDTVRLLDSNKAENKIVQDSKGSPLVGDDNIVKTTRSMTYGFTSSSSNPWEDSPIGSFEHGLSSGFAYSKHKAEPGYDMAIYQHGYPVAAIRFTEFNTEAINNITSKLGMSDDQYLVCGSGSEGRVYLLQYPVGYIKGFSLDESKSKYEASIGKSDLEVNIKTGKVYKVADNGTTAEVNNEDSYLKLSNGTADSSSFKVYGTTGISKDTNSGAWNLKYGEENKLVDMPRVVLTDYLELSYSPGIVDGYFEVDDSGNSNATTYKLVAYGRKFRIENFSGTLGTQIGYFCGMDNVKPSSPQILYISDICDVDKLLSNTPYVRYIPDSGAETLSSETDLADIESKIDDLTDYSPERTDDMKVAAVSEISSTVTFPGEKVWMKDYSLYDSKPYFYGMVITKNFRDSGLMNWISSESLTDSCVWWNNWLSTHKFSYNINSDATLNYLKGAYTYELNESGIITLNLETIAKIQKEINSEHEISSVQNMRTIFKVMGYSLVGYAFILMMSWVVDTSVDLGFNILGILSFKKLIAVKSEEEIPQDGDEKVRYTEFSSIVLIALKLASLGIVLILFDVITIVQSLLVFCGGVMRFIAGIFGGV